MYSWMSNGDTPTANVTGIHLTPTRTIYTMQAGSMILNVTFLSPIEVRDHRYGVIVLTGLAAMLTAILHPRIAFGLGESVSSILIPRG